MRRRKNNTERKWGDEEQERKNTGRRKLAERVK